jgi:hypothetical protein
MGLMDKLKDAISKNPSKARHTADKTAETIDKRTGGKYSDQIRRGRKKLDEHMKKGEQPRRDEDK